MKAEKLDSKNKNLGLMWGRFVAFLARESTVSLPCIPIMVGDSNKNYVLCEPSVKADG